MKENRVYIMVVLMLVVFCFIFIWGIVIEFKNQLDWNWWRSTDSSGVNNAEIARNIVWSLTFPALGLIGIGLGVWRSISAARQVSAAIGQVSAGLAQNNIFDEENMSSRFSTAVELLGSSSTASRVGGVAMLRSVAEEAPDRFGSVIGETVIGSLAALQKEIVNGGICPPDINLAINFISTHQYLVHPLTFDEKEKIMKRKLSYVQGLDIERVTFRDNKVHFF